MSTELQQFGKFLRETADADFDRLLAAVACSGEHFARVMAEGHLAYPVRQSFLTIAESIEQDDPSILFRYGKEIGLQRGRQSFTVHELMQASECMRHHIWQRLEVFLADRTPWPYTTAQGLEDFLYTFFRNYIASVDDALEEARVAVAAQSRQLELQQQTIRELGVPIVPVLPGVLALPLIGTIDGHRALNILDTLLDAITRHQADIVIIDMTGVPSFDTVIAEYLLQAARAANLVGAQIILVGIGAKMAQTMAQPGVDLRSVISLANLQVALEYVYQRRGKPGKRT